MYLGFAVTALDLIFSLMTLGRYTRDVNNTKAALARQIRPGRIAAENATLHNQDLLVSVMALSAVAALLGLIGWAWTAVAARRGRGWTRRAGTVLLVAYSICALIVLTRSDNAPGVLFTTVLVWVIGVATVVPLWTRQASEFFAAWRRR
jgi:hypothetical protein